MDNHFLNGLEPIQCKLVLQYRCLLFKFSLLIERCLRYACLFPSNEKHTRGVPSIFMQREELVKIGIVVQRRQNRLFCCKR